MFFISITATKIIIKHNIWLCVFKNGVAEVRGGEGQECRQSFYPVFYKNSVLLSFSNQTRWEPENYQVTRELSGNQRASRKQRPLGGLCKKFSFKSYKNLTKGNRVYKLWFRTNLTSTLTRQSRSVPSRPWRLMPIQALERSKRQRRKEDSGQIRNRGRCRCGQETREHSVLQEVEETLFPNGPWLWGCGSNRYIQL